ncbi:MAG: ABC transporter permease [Ruminococcus sp.]|nr:ABC transporter permease [Ruminococcus sp.]
MQVFKVFMKVLKSRMSAAFLYILIFMIIAIPQAKSSTTEKKFERVPLKIAVFDEDNTPESRKLTEFIAKDNKLISMSNDREELIDALYWMRLDYALIINKGYSENLLSDGTNELFGSYHVHDSYSVSYMSTALDQYVSSVRAYSQSGEDLDSAIAHTEDALSQDTEVHVAEAGKNGVNGQSSTFRAYFNYFSYIITSVIIYTVCPIILTMTRKDIRYRTNCSSIHPNAYTIQLFAGSTVLVLGVWLILIVAGIFATGGFYSGKQWLAVLNSFIYTLVSTSIALLITSFDPSENILNLTAQILGLGMSFLCGVFVPLSMLSDSVASVSKFLPAYWYIRCNSMICGNEIYDIGRLASFMLIQMLFAVVCSVLTMLIRRIKFGTSSEVAA